MTTLLVFGIVFAFASALVLAQNDPGVRGGAAGAGGPVSGLTAKEGKFFDSGLDAFGEVASVTGSVVGTEPGLGPRFNLTSCAGCHAAPAIGGTSPASNPQLDPQINPASPAERTAVTGPILQINGPVREVRFAFQADGTTPDGGVHDLFTIAGLPGTPAGCSISQPNFTNQSNLRFRIPTPTFGLGLIEAIEDATILANETASNSYGVPPGKANRNGNDGTVTRFGWKGQNKSLVIFSGEAYNVEQGITNELFPDERGEGGTPDSVACRQVMPAPKDSVHYELTQPQRVIDDVGNFANFMRFLAAPVQVSTYVASGLTITSQQISLGEAAFDKAGCSVCHVKKMTTGNHVTAALRFKDVRLFSDLLLHDVGTGDDISQGLAAGAQFKTAPLWGVGQRRFFLHDGRATDLLGAIDAHGNDAAPVISNFHGTGSPSQNLGPTERQNLIYFLRSL